SALAREHMIVTRRTAVLQETFHRCGRVLPQRTDPILATLAMELNLEDPGELEIAAADAERLADARPGRVEVTEERMIACLHALPYIWLTKYHADLLGLEVRHDRLRCRLRG